MKTLVAFMLSLAAGFLLMTAYVNAETIRLCTGAGNGVYYQAGKAIQKMAGSGIEVIETDGTFDNMNRLLDKDECDAMIAQPDGPVYLARTSPAKAKQIRQIAPLHREYLHVLCSKESGLKDLGYIAGGKHSLAVGPNGSGSWLIWQNILEEDESYKSVPVTPEGGIIALSSVASNDTTCMLVPAGLNNGTVLEADSLFAASVVLAHANDKDFNDALDITGKPLYTYKDIPSGTYPKLQSGWFGSKVSTITWNAGVYVNVEKFTDAKKLAVFIQAVSRAAIGIRAEFGE